MTKSASKIGRERLAGITIAWFDPLPAPRVSGLPDSMRKAFQRGKYAWQVVMVVVQKDGQYHIQSEDYNGRWNYFEVHKTLQDKVECYRRETEDSNSLTYGWIACPSQEKIIDTLEVVDFVAHKLGVWIDDEITQLLNEVDNETTRP